VNQKTGNGMLYFAEIHQMRIGATLWEGTELYILNSPIFYVDKLSTPILLMSNKLDAVVPFWQGVEFFTALRRLGKRAWMLQYDGEPHSLFRYNNMLDYTVRMTQFFDHYLKDAPAPKWMTRGVPALNKRSSKSFELDNDIRTPELGGLLTDDERVQVEALKSKKATTLTLE
jgi:acetyl esterase/lipase